MSDIVLCTLNARYIHAAFGLRYLLANLGALAERACLLEFDVAQRPTDIVEQLLVHQPRIVGLGVYIWNASASLQVVAELKRIAPETIVVLGGPEVSFETEQQEICRLADYVITGEADLAFAELCGQLLCNRRPLLKIIPAVLPAFEGDRAIRLPYHLYGPRDVTDRVIYVEASRGCPFKCEFCLSSLDVPVRQAPMDALLAALADLLDRGVRQFKFVDRTFNLNLNVSRAILQFFLDRWRLGLFLHFEMIPDRLPEALRALIAQFPAGALQFEVGIQSFNEQVTQRISRRQDNPKLEDNLRFLRGQTGVHVHADLIAGLPGEDLASFARGFDRLLALAPQEIQVGILKRLRGTPIVRHDAEWGMVYSSHPPYEVLRTNAIDFPTMQRVRRFARYWDLIGNSGNFPRTLPLLWPRATPATGSNLPSDSEDDAAEIPPASPFWRFMQLSDWLHARLGKNFGIALVRLAEMLFQFMTTELKESPAAVAVALWQDYARNGRRDRPDFLKPYIAADARRPTRQAAAEPLLPRRQARHLRPLEELPLNLAE